MTLNPNNDVYTGDLSILNVRKHAWARMDNKSSAWNILKYVTIAAGLAAMLFMGTRTYGGTTTQSQLPLHLTIWISLLVIFLVTRHGKRIAEEPFVGFHSARFEVDDDTVYYVYQQGMTLRTYYIHDKDIRKIYRDDEAGVILIEGEAVINIQRRSGETEDKVSEFYALVPFDKYDLDDLLNPYKKKVTKCDGKLRGRFDEGRDK